MADDTRSVPAALGTQRNNAEYCTGRQATLKQALSEHIAILDALATRRPSTARKAMAEHIASQLEEALASTTSRRRILADCASAPSPVALSAHASTLTSVRLIW